LKNTKWSIFENLIFINSTQLDDGLIDISIFIW